MRETYRNLNNQNYWEKRWGNIKTDDPMINLNKYPLKYTLEIVNLKNKDQKILEAGCGAGRILKYLHNLQYDIIGFDFIKTAVDKIKFNNPNIKVLTSNIMNTPFEDKQFDTILAFGLYHNFKYEEVITALNETKRILKDNGNLFFSFRKDNLQNLILDYLKNKKNNLDNSNFHKLNLKEDELKKLLNLLNLKIIKKYYIINMPILIYFKIFRSKKQKNFDEHVGRRDGYSLNLIGSCLNYFFSKFFSKHYCNVIGILCKKN